MGNRSDDQFFLVSKGSLRLLGGKKEEMKRMSILCLVLIKGLLEKTGKHHYQKEVSRSFMEVRGPFFPRIFTSKLHVHISHGHLEERKPFQLLCSGRALVAAFISTSVTGTLGAVAHMCV